MAAAGDSVSAGLIRHPRGWLVVRLSVPMVRDSLIDLYLMLNTGRPHSALSVPIYRMLDALGHLRPSGGTGVVMRNARLGRVAMPDIPMRLSAGPALLGLEGMLGLDFLALFAEARLDVRAPHLTLMHA